MIRMGFIGVATIPTLRHSRPMACRRGRSTSVASLRCIGVSRRPLSRLATEECPQCRYSSRQTGNSSSRMSRVPTRWLLSMAHETSSEISQLTKSSCLAGFTTPSLWFATGEESVGDVANRAAGWFLASSSVRLGLIHQHVDCEALRRNPCKQSIASDSLMNHHRTHSQRSISRLPLPHTTHTTHTTLIGTSMRRR